MAEYIKRLIHKIKKRRQCKRMGYRCPDCIYHNFVIDNKGVFRGNICYFDAEDMNGDDRDDGYVQEFVAMDKEDKEAIDMAIEALSAEADAEPMTEEVREALMRLTMCAREECDMCKYKEKCGFEFQYNISTENMHTILDALSEDKTDRPKGEWIDVENEPYCECSVCGSYIDNLDDDYAFCPRCGADMRGGDANDRKQSCTISDYAGSGGWENERSKSMSRCKYAQDISGGCLECTAYKFMYCEAQVFDLNDDGSTNIVKCEEDKWGWVKRNWEMIKEQEHE